MNLPLLHPRTIDELPVRRSFHLGLSIGLPHQRSGAVIVERVEERSGGPRFRVRWLEQWKHETWEDLLRAVRRVLVRPPLQYLPPTITINVTEGGLPLVDLCDRLLEDQMLLPVLIQPGRAVPDSEQRPLRVGERELLSAVQLVLQSDRLELADLPLTDALKEQIKLFGFDRAQTDPVTAAITAPGAQGHLAVALGVTLWTMQQGLFEGFWEASPLERLDRHMPEAFQTAHLAATLRAGGPEVLADWLHMVEQLQPQLTQDDGVQEWMPVIRRART